MQEARHKGSAWQWITASGGGGKRGHGDPDDGDGQWRSGCFVPMRVTPTQIRRNYYAKGVRKTKVKKSYDR